MSMINDYDAKKNMWCPPETVQMLANPAARENLTAQIEDFAEAEHEPGIVVDFESLPESSQQDFQLFIHDLGVALHGKTEAYGGAACGRLELRLQILRFAGRCHHSDELRLPVVHLGARTDRAAGLVHPAISITW